MAMYSTFSNQYGSYSPTNFTNQFVNTAQNYKNMASQAGYYPPSFSQQFVQRALNQPASNQAQYTSSYPSLGGVPNVPGQGVPGYMTPQQQSVMYEDLGPWGTGKSMGPVVGGRVQTGGGSFTPEGYYSTGYQGSGEAPWITGESSPGVYKSGSFGSVYSPDLSNAVKVNEYNKYLQSQGLPPIGDPNQVAAEYNRTGKYTPPQNVLAFTSPGYTSYTGERIGTSTAPGGITGTTTAQAAPTSTLDAIARKLQQGAGNVGQALTNIVGTLIKPASSAYALAPGETVQPKEGLLEAIRRKVGQGIETVGTMLGLPEWTISETAAGGATPLTGQTETSAQVYSPYRYTPEEKAIGGTQAGETLWGTAYTPGEAPQFVGKESLLTTEVPPAIASPNTDSYISGGYPGNGVIAQNPEVADYVMQAIMDLVNSLGTSEFAAGSVDTSAMDGWYQDALQQSGMTESQAALDAINKQIQVVSDLIDNLDGDITEEAKNFLMTEAQRRRLVATRGKPLRDELAKLVAGASKYGVNIKNAISLLEQQVNLKKSEAQQRLEAQKAVDANKRAQVSALTNLLPYMTPTAGQQLSAQSAMERALLKQQETGGNIADLLNQ